MIDHVCAHMQKMSNKKEITYTIYICDCTHYAVGCDLTNFWGMRYHSGILVPHPGINTSLCEVLMMMMFELLMQTGVIIHTHTCTYTHIIMLFGFMFLPIGCMMQEKQ